MENNWDINCNIGYICTTYQCSRGLGEKIAMRWIGREESVDFSFSSLDQQSNRFANVLQGLGIGEGEIFFTFLPRMPEQFFGFLGALKAKVVCCPLFSSFGEDALLDRLADSRAKCILTKKSLLKKVQRIRKHLPDLQFIILVDGDERPSEGIYNLGKLLDSVSPHFCTSPTSPDQISVIHYTSGSTGKPKGVVHRHGSILSQSRTAKEVLGLSENDIYWCTADQGWVTGTSYGIIGPWSLGVTQVHFSGSFDALEWIKLLMREEITVWYTAPTALRMLMREDEKLLSNIRVSRLRSIFSVGEPLNPEVIHWSRRILGREIYDTWFQTETGAIMIANLPDFKVKPGSMGRPVEGIDVAILSENGEELPDGEQGNLCIRSGWPSMFMNYLNADEVYRKKFYHGFYNTGDIARRDGDGYYWFLGRGDDVINTAGHLVSPFEVESALLEIEEVAESGVIGVDDEILFEKIVAYVHLHEGFHSSKELELKIRIHISNRVSSIATPQEIVFCDGIPKNKSGKIMRRILRARFSGNDEGDISTMEMRA